MSSNLKIAAMVRDIDTMAAEIPTQASHLLDALMQRALRRSGVTWVGVHRLSRRLNLHERNVRRWLQVLEKLDLVSVRHGRHHEPNTYHLNLDRLASMPSIQSGRQRPPCRPGAGAHPDDSDRALASAQGGRSRRADRALASKHLLLEDLREDPKKRKRGCAAGSRGWSSGDGDPEGAPAARSRSRHPPHGAAGRPAPRGPDAGRLLGRGLRAGRQGDGEGA